MLIWGGGRGALGCGVKGLGRGGLKWTAEVVVEAMADMMVAERKQCIKVNTITIVFPMPLIRVPIVQASRNSLVSQQKVTLTSAQNIYPTSKTIDTYRLPHWPKRTSHQQKSSPRPNAQLPSTC
jgi:hypothetical protein